MKYVRTEDKIVVVNYWCKDEQGYYTWLTAEWCQPKLYIYKKDIVAEADTIEKLIDEYVLAYEGCKPKPIDREQVKTCYLLGQTQYIKGAIWTDKGLIYVAKLNDKGELELL